MFRGAEGGIVNRTTFAMIGEDGAEALIPLTKPNRAAKLMEESGLLAFAGKMFASGSIPMFHQGGVVGDSGSSYDGSRGMTSAETLALLRNGEGVMNEQMMANMTAAQLHEFRSGNARWWAAGGPYEQGRSAGSSTARLGSPSDAAAMRTTYEGYILPMVRLLGSAFKDSSNDMTASSLGKVAGATFDYAKGYSDVVAESQARYFASIGLPPGFDINGAVPSGFDIPHWRTFLGANAGPGSFPFLISYLKAAGIPHLVNSTVRPGAITVSGNKSLHSVGRAVDFGAPNDANYDSPGLLRINRAFVPVMDVLRELIYSGPGGIVNKSYGAKVMAGHHNHVHVGLAEGGIVQDLVYAMLGESGPEVVIPLDDPIRALTLARRSGLLQSLAAAQMQQSSSLTASSAVNPARRSSPSDSDGGILGGGPGNTYHINGIGFDQVRREIAARDEASLRRRH
jgi:hypothetical protein